jgi:glyoxylase-like metal-dependent hydrolase (beta-lactamase superfamily II)
MPVAAVFGAIREFGRSPDQLKRLIFTHGHPDHIGSAAAIVRETGARTHMHPLAHGGPIVCDTSTRFRNKWGKK